MLPVRRASPHNPDVPVNPDDDESEIVKRTIRQIDKIKAPEEPFGKSQRPHTARSIVITLNQERAELRARWDRLAAQAKAAQLGTYGLAFLASHCGLEWYGTRGDEPLSRFLGLSGAELMNLRSFGKSKVGRLCQIVERTLEDSGSGLPISSPASLTLDPREALVIWEFPEDFPCRLIALPVRIAGYCARHGISTLGQLLTAWESLGFHGFKSQKNLGSKSVRRLEALVEALRRIDLSSASSFLPLAPSGKGLSFSRALELVATEPSEVDRPLLVRRLIERMTLEVSAEEGGLTRERVRQVESGFLTEIKARLDYFSGERDRLLAAWIGGGNWLVPDELTGLVDNRLLLVAAIDAIFRDTPQAIAKAMGEELRLAGWLEELLTHPELWCGGVNFSEFLETRVPAQDRERFCEALADSSELKVDHGHGKVHPARTGLRQVVEGLLAEEDDPIPLTWLLQLLVRTGHYPTATRELLRRHRRAWVRRPDFPHDKILWSE